MRRQRPTVRQRTAKVARWLHIYLSMVSFAVVLFFAGTGLTVNHPEWFAKSVSTRQLHGVVGPELVTEEALAGANRDHLVQAVRSRGRFHGTVEDIRVDEAEVSFSFRAPGYSADVIVDRPAGTYSATEVRNGFVAIVNDLHKGRDAGPVWHGLIDVSAVLLVLVSGTGLVTLWFVYRHRSSGLLLALAGCAFCGLLYVIFVP